MENQFSKNNNLASNQKGQAALEYVLILFIVVALITGVLFKFGSAFRFFGENIVGTQLECALTYGQLPGNLPAGVNCDDPQIGAGGAGAGSGGTDGSGEANNPDGSGDPNNTKDKNGDHDGSNSSNSASNISGGSGSDGFFSSGSGRRNRRSIAANAGGEEKKDAAGADSEGISRGSRKIIVIDETIRVGGGNRSRYIPVPGEQKKKQAATAVSGIAAKVDSNEIRTAKKIPVVTEDRKPAEIPKDEPMSFGQFFKYLVIAAIVIALVVFFGSQVMNFQNSKE